QLLIRPCPAQLPTHRGGRCPPPVLGHGGVADAHALTDRAVAQPLRREAEDLLDLSHGQPLCRHAPPSLLGSATRGVQETASCSGHPASLSPPIHPRERGGRNLPEWLDAMPGMSGRLAPEWVEALVRNGWKHCS